MKRLLVALILALALMLTIGASIASARGAPGAILVAPGPGGDVVIIPPEEGDTAPPDILIKTPNGPRPREHIPPGT